MCVFYIALLSAMIAFLTAASPDSCTQINEINGLSAGGKQGQAIPDHQPSLAKAFTQDGAKVAGGRPSSPSEPRPAQLNCHCNKHRQRNCSVSI